MGHQMLTELIILTGFFITIATILHYLKQPIIIGFILAGIVTGPYGFHFVKTLPEAQQITEIGVILLMFTIGLEFSFKRLTYLKKLFINLGTTQIMSTIVVISGLFLLFIEMNLPKALFCGCLVALSSTAIVMKLLQESREIGSPFGNASVAILLSQDLAVIPMMLALSLFAFADSFTAFLSFKAIFIWLIEIIAIGFFLYLGSRWIIPFILEKVVKTRSKELFFFSLVFLCFGVSWLIELSGLSLSLGAFLAGMMISESPYGKQATADIVPLRDNFLGIFFASIGMLIDLRFLVDHWLTILVLLVVVLTVKILIIFLLSLGNRLPRTTSLITALMVFQIGEFSFILAQKGYSVGIITPDELQYFLTLSAITMILTPIIFKWAPRIVLAKKSKDSREDSMIVPSVEMAKLMDQKEQIGHAIVIGYGVAGSNLCGIFTNLNLPYKIIEHNYKTVQTLKEKGEVAFYGDASREEILAAAGIYQAGLVIITVSGLSMTEAITDTIKRIRPDVKVIIRLQYSLETQRLRKIPNTELIVAEYETTIELIARTLKSYGVESKKIEKCMLTARRQLGVPLSNLSDYIRNTLDLPTWDMIATIRPLKVKADSFAIGCTVFDLDLRLKTNATLVAIYRPEKGTLIAKDDAVIAGRDILYLIGDDKAFAKAVELINSQSN